VIDASATAGPVAPAGGSGKGAPSVGSTTEGPAAVSGPVGSADTAAGSGAFAAAGTEVADNSYTSGTGVIGAAAVGGLGVTDVTGCETDDVDSLGGTTRGAGPGDAAASVVALGGAGFGANRCTTGR
jgi:hypothetical protein